MKRLIIVLTETLLAGSLLTGCDGISKSSDGTDEQGNAIKATRIEFVAPSLMGWVQNEGDTSIQAHGLDANGTRLKFADGTDASPARVATHEMTGDLGHYLRNVLEFASPAGSQSWQLTPGNIPHRSCNFSPIEGKFSDLKIDTKIEGNCQYRLPVVVENLKESLTLVLNGNVELQVTPTSEGEAVKTEFLYDTPEFADATTITYTENDAEAVAQQKKWLRDTGANNQTDITDVDVLMHYLVREEAGHITVVVPQTIQKDAIYSVAIKEPDTGCTIKGGEGKVESQYVTTFIQKVKPGYESSYVDNAAVDRTFRVIEDEPEIVVTCSAALPTVAGTAMGLHGTLVLEDQDGNQATVTADTKADTKFAFTQGLTPGGEYNLKVATNPQHQVCTISSGASGTVPPAGISDVEVTCQYATYSISGTVAGQTGAFSLAHGSTTVDIAANATSYEITGLTALNSYAVTVQAHPAGQTCTVGATGTGASLTGNISDANITCSVNTYEIGGTVSGLSGQVTLQLNGGNNLVVTANGAFAFGTELAAGASYSVTVSANPTNQVCTVTGDSGTANADVTNVAVACANNEYTLRVNVSGLTGGTLNLRNQINLNSLAVTTNGLSTFSEKITVVGAYDYDVRVLGQPAGQTCTLSGDVGTASGDVTVTATCAAATYKVGGTVAGIPNAESVTLRLTYGPGNTTEDLQVNWDFMADPVNFEFTADLDNADAYSVTIQTQPTSATCSVDAGGSGNISGADVTNVDVGCM